MNKEIIKKLKNKNYYTYGFNRNSNFKILNVKRNIDFTEYDLSINLPNKKKILIKSIKYHY